MLNEMLQPLNMMECVTCLLIIKTAYIWTY